ncbi:MerR family transcriptional regulator [Hoyosella rhizosphaerae]|uniref:MerR family transcriptional regulator n=1 Tax=Hoyosella rhizosphaerae TaxID=1755582 RepID=A0A916U156_9ACTN|nr:MerR family transcriptional regulator [Hoyosella rhizosphaerae]MBN4927299.1 MerR family transcriptional regulator [Hoyosella rhizosphaerae]GGC52376.1 MerR family transcriptional regulator [Hoyosella rhizosphaerae]
MTAASHPLHGSGLSIGAVLDQLRPDFPDVTISKIRFLESEGLVSPQRTPSGYRRFSAGDCERLRFVLTAQRDHYLPLKVIREQLDAIDQGSTLEGPVVRLPRSFAVSTEEQFDAGPGGSRISGEELLERTGVDKAFLKDLVTSGFLKPGNGGYFDGDSVTLVKTAHALAEFGLDTRHLRSFRMAAERQADLLAQIAGPVAKGREAGAKDRAEEIVRELGSLIVSAHGALLKAAVRESLR